MRIELKNDHKCLLIFICLNGLASSYLADKTKFVSELYPYYSQNAINNAFFIPRPKAELFRHTFYLLLPISLDTLPSEIRNAKGISLYKQKLKIFLMEQQAKE